MEANEHDLRREQICFPVLPTNVVPSQSITVTGPLLAGGQRGFCEPWLSSCRKVEFPEGAQKIPRSCSGM